MKGLVSKAKFLALACVACGALALFPSLAQAQVDLPDVGIDMAEWIDAVVASWFGFVATVIGIVLIGAIIWRVVRMLRSKATATN